MTVKSYKVSDSLYLVSQSIKTGTQATKPAEVPVNHVAVIDCSGSMWGDLPRVREQLKKKLPKLLNEKDTISIIWFSGRGEFGTLLEAEPVSTLADLNQVNSAIDRWLKPVGLTGFKEPLEEVSRLVDKISKQRPGAFSLFFMSDGCDNVWPRQDILSAVTRSAGKLTSATFVEYGYYADRQLLAGMAEKAGGALIFADAFDKYAPAFEAAISKKVSGVKKVEVRVSGDVVGGFVYALQDGDLVTFAVEGNKASVPEGLDCVWYLSPASTGTFVGDCISGFADGPDPKKDNAVLLALPAAYAALSLFSVRMKPEVIFPLLKAVGDVALISRFSGLFGKQKYSEFMEAAKNAAFDASKRYEKGYNPNLVPRDDALTVLDVLRILQEDESSRVLLDHPSFKYSRIGRGRVDASSHLTDQELEEVRKLSDQLSKEHDPSRISELSARIAAITANKSSALEFVQDPAPDGYPISSLTFNEDRPNVSFLVRKSGYVDLSDRAPKNVTEALASDVKKFNTFVYRNYAVVKDGLVNIENLPVLMSSDSYEKLLDMDLPGEALVSREVRPDNVVALVLNLRALPVINRRMTKSLSAKAFFEKNYALVKAQAVQKVYGAYAKELLPARKSEGFVQKYGEETTGWLKEQGITEYSGFAPKTVQTPSTDVYMGKELKTSLKGFSKLPSLKEVKESVKKGKINAPTALMNETVKEVEEFLNSSIYIKAAQKERVLEAWLDGQTKDSKSKARKLIYEVAQDTFVVVVGQTWFSEFSSLDENSMTIDVNGQKVDCKVDMREVEINI